MASDEIDDLSFSLGAFEAAVTAKAVDLPDIRLSRILLALDGSEQDPTGVGLVEAIARATKAKVGVLADGGADGDAVLARLEKAEVPAERVPARAEAEPFARLLAAAEAFGADLLALPSPFLQSLEAYGRESVGDTLEVIMSRWNEGLLVVRSPLDEPAACLRDILVPVVYDTPENPLAVAWSLALAAPQATLRLVEVADTSVLESAADLLGEYLDARALEAETLERLEAKQHAGLVAVLQREAAKRNLNCKVTVRVGDATAVVTEAANEATRLIVTSCPLDPSSLDHQRVQSFIRESRNPVLVV